MASYRPFPPPTQSTFAQAPLSNQNSLQAQPPPGQGRGGQYSQNWGYNGAPGSNYQQQYNPTALRSQAPPPPQFAPPPPPPDSSYPPPPPPSVPAQSGPPPSMYYPTSQQYSQYNQNQAMQPPPPPSPPPSSSLPPPPPPPASPPRPPSPAPPAQSKESSRHKDGKDSGWREPGHSNHLNSSRHRKPPVASVPEKKTHGHPGRGVETEEERRLRKKKEYEKQRQEEKHRQQVKESQNRILQKTQMLSSGIKGQGSITGSHIGERRTTPLLAGERAENRLKKPTTFLCKLK